MQGTIQVWFRYPETRNMGAAMTGRVKFFIHALDIFQCLTEE
jgi:hypothetical protein